LNGGRLTLKLISKALLPKSGPVKAFTQLHKNILPQHPKLTSNGQIILIKKRKGQLQENSIQKGNSGKMPNGAAGYFRGFKGNGPRGRFLRSFGLPSQFWRGGGLAGQDSAPLDKNPAGIAKKWLPQQKNGQTSLISTPKILTAKEHPKGRRNRRKVGFLFFLFSNFICYDRSVVRD